MAHTKKIIYFWGFTRVRENNNKKRDFCEEFKRDSLNLAYTRKKTPINFYHFLFHRYKKNISPVPFRGHGDKRGVKSLKRDVFSN